MTIKEFFLNLFQPVIEIFEKLFPRKPKAMNYILRGPSGYIATFTLTLPVFSFSLGVQFGFKSQEVVVNGTSKPDSILIFNVTDAGGLESAFGTIPILHGPQIYAGVESSPRLLSGVFNLTGALGAYTLQARV